MKKTAILALLLFTLFTANAQKKRIDTLRLALSKAKTDTMRYGASINLSFAYYLPNPDSSIIFAQQAYLLAKKNNWASGQEKCLNNIANSYASLADYVKSLQFYFKAVKIAGELNDLFEMSFINDNIGATYIQEQDYKKALPYLRLAQKQLNTFALSHKFLFKHKRTRAFIYGNTGEGYLDMHQADSAEYYLNIAYNESKKLNLTDNIGWVQRDLGEVEVEKGNKAGALQLFRQAVISDKAVDDGEDVSIACLSTASLYHKYKQQDSAEYYALKALEAAATGKFEQDVLNAGKVLYTFYDEDHNLPQAYKYFKITTAAKDSLYSQDKVKQLLSLDFDEKERQQELQVAQKEAQAEAENRLRTYILSGGLGVLLLLALIFWRNSRQRQKANAILSKTLSDLKATQTQLIQSEKMASLGELTAGIAHEIQNPLNFVNNFSEVNTEMLDELDEELSKGDIAEAKAIAADIRQNEQKINHHGKRADFIVKGMLEHSRSGTGERQPTNINILAEEFFKLSYQVLRAKDKEFNAELITHFDANLPKANVVQQDIGRVLLNLFNNAFYAVNQKAKTAGNDYKPEVILTTLRENGSLLIKVKDNGVGIPDAIKEKIMQPFFTTKPTGEGTGLGLSLTYDMVVKGHGGSIKVDSVEGEGSEFMISLPVG
jgi:two-component system NtrC family sensor kinase